MSFTPRKPAGLGKCLACGSMSVKLDPISRFSNAAVFVQIPEFVIPFASSLDNRVLAKVTIEVFSLDPLHKDDRTLTALALQLALERMA